MKKYLILAVVTLLAVALSACSGNVKSNDTSAENTTTQVSTSVYETVQTTNAELPKIYNPTNVEIRVAVFFQRWHPTEKQNRIAL